MYDFVIKHGRAYVAGQWTTAFIYGKQGKTALISTAEYPAKEIIDANGMDILPGLIDPHVHFALDLGFIKSRDDFYHGSLAALHGGITSVIDFLEPTSNAKDLEASYYRRLLEAKDCLVDYHFHATIKKPDGDLKTYVLKMMELGMYTLKLFTTYSDSGRRTSDQDIIELLKLSNKYHFLLMAHVEDDGLIKLDKQYTYRDLPTSRPSQSELNEALKLAGYVERYGGYLYMVHLSSGATLEALVNEYPHLINKRFFIESCPQYFLFNHDVLLKPNGHLYTCAPPLRSQTELELLHQYQDYVMTIGTDHCAFNEQDKKTLRLVEMPLGVAGIEFSFALMYRIYQDKLIDKMSSNVAKLMGLVGKGKIEVGYDADFAFFKHDPAHVINAHHGATDHTIYQGLLTAGTFNLVMRRGIIVLDNRAHDEETGHLIQGRQPI